MRKIILSILIIPITAMFISAQQKTSWRGPERNGIYTETGLLREWPDKGPEVRWLFEGLGQGYASPSFANGKIYITGMTGQTGYVFILTEEGVLESRYEYGPEFHESYPGSRSTPLIVKDLLYMVSGMGKIMSLEADTGKEIWSKCAISDFGGSNIRWGITENLLIDGDMIFFAPGGKKHSIVALDRFTGDIVWSAAGTGKGDLSAYCSPLIINLPERKLLVTHMANDVVGLDAGTGEFLWSHPFTNRNFIHANTPVYEDGNLYVFSTDESGSVKFDLSSDGSRIGVVWENKEVRNLQGGAVILDDHIYTPSYVDRRWYSIDRTSGRSTFSSRDIDRGVVIYADGRLYCYSEKGELALVRPNPREFEIISKIIIEAGTGEHFSHPVIHKGKLYVRRGDALIVFNLTE